MSQPMRRSAVDRDAFEDRIDRREREQHQRVMEKVRQAIEPIMAFADDPHGLELSVDFHADRYGDVKLNVRVTRRPPPK